MKQSTYLRSPSWQRGVAAVELAIILPVLVALLGVPFFFGRVCMHYAVAEKAAHDAARYLSSIPVTEMKSQARIGAVLDIAQQIYAAETAELNPGPYPATPGFRCNSIPCAGLSVPDTVSVSVQMRVVDIFLPVFTTDYTDEEGGIVLLTDVTLPYVGK